MRILPIFPLQIFSELTNNRTVIFKSIKNPDETCYGDVRS